MNVVGLIIEIDEEVRYIKSKHFEALSVRNFLISDQSKKTIKCAIWGNQADDFNIPIGTVIKIEQAKLTTYGGYSLSILRTSIIKNISHLDNNIVKNLIEDFETNNLNTKKLKV